LERSGQSRKYFNYSILEIVTAVALIGRVSEWLFPLLFTSKVSPDARQTTHLHPTRVLSAFPGFLQHQVDRQRDDVVHEGDRLDRANGALHPKAVHSGMAIKNTISGQLVCKFE